MPPTTRSHGVPAPSRVYNSTTTPQQAQFPPRRRVVRTYGKQNRRTPARNLRQQTLTQFDFVSSFDEEKDPIVLSSDSEDMGEEEGEVEDKEEEEEEESNDENQEERQPEEDEDDEDKENRPVKEPEIEINDQETEGEAEDENEEPVSNGRKRRSTSKKATTNDSRAKRRRTLGDDSGKKKTKNGKSSRRRTIGDAPASSSSYHTQTLTQFPHFLGRGSAEGRVVRDSDDEDDGFQDWLQDPASPTPKRTTVQPSRSPLKTLFERERTESRQSSVVPQTPTRPPRDEIPSSSQASTPMSTVVNHAGNPILQDPSSSKIYSSPSARPVVTPSKASTTTTSSPLSTLRSTMLNRYGPPDLHGPSPSQRKASSLVTTPVVLKLTGKPKPKAGSTTPKLEIQDTFATESWGSGGLTPTPKRQKPVATPQRAMTPTRESSSLEEEEDEMETPTKPRQRRSSAELGDQRKTKTPTPRKMKKVSPHKSKKVMLEIPDSDDEDEGFDSDDDGGFIAGPETQFVMNEIASSEEEAAMAPTASIPAPTPAVRALQELKSSSAMSKTRRHATSSPPIPSSQPTSPGLPSSPPKTSSSNDTRIRLRKPRHQPTQAPLQTQPLESQRVPLATLQALPSATFRSDILLPITPDVLLSVIGGYEVNVVLPVKIPVQVARFWLFDGEWLRYMACADGAEPEKGSWRYHLSQVYELNNPLEGSDMREEGWLEGDIGKYIYIPPAVVGQLLWNLRHELFRDGDTEETQGDELEPASSPLSGGRTKNQAPTPTPNLSVSQQVEAQLQSDIAHSTQFPTSDDILVPSTPEQESASTPSTSKAASKLPSSSAKPAAPPPSHLTNPPTSYRASRPPLTRPSQATTASQASTPEKHSHAPSTFYTRPSHHSSSSIVFESIGDSSPIRMPQSVPLGSSQLLTKSQMLPDSLMQDDARIPPEIWDSDEDADATL